MPTSEVGELIDIVPTRIWWPARDVLLRFVIAVVIAIVSAIPLFVLLFWTASYERTVSLRLLVVAAGLLWLVVFLRLLKSAMAAEQRRIERVLGDDPSASTVELLHRALGDPPAFESMVHDRILVRSLIGAGRLGTTLRVGKARAMTAVTPLVVAFEPRRLDGPSSEVKALEDASGLVDAVRANLAAPKRSWGMPALVGLKRRLGRTTAGICTVFLLAGLLLALRARPVDTGFAILLLLAVPVVGAIASRGRVHYQWFLVPAGLVFRSARPLGQGWDVELFERRSSVLMICDAHRKQCSVLVANRTTSRGLQIDRDKAALLLRAWLSPLPPPDPAKLSDLE